MKIKIEKEEKNPLLKRLDVNIFIDHEGGATPSKADIQKKLSAEKGWDVDKIEVKYVHSIYGSPLSKGVIKVWDKAQEHLKPKEEETPKGETPAPASEAPKEEKVEEASKPETKEEEKPAEEKKADVKEESTAKEKKEES